MVAAPVAWALMCVAFAGDATAESPEASTCRSYSHDGFYLRFGTGPVYAGTSVTTGQLSHPDYQLDGPGLTLDVEIGGSALPGLATGGALSLSTFAFGDDQGSSSLVMLGAFVDAIPVTWRGWHAGGLLGVASVRTSTESGRDEFEGGGLGLAGWLGHDVWLSGNWSLGGQLRARGVLARDPGVDDVIDATELNSTTYEVALLISALYY